MGSPGVLICIDGGCTTCTPDTYALGFVDNGDGTITAPATCLVWEKKSNDATLHDKDARYQWAGTCSDTTSQYCQPSVAAADACAAGTASASTVGCALCPDGETCNCGTDACNVDAASPENITTVWQWLVWLNDGSGFAGATDWRIPKVQALSGGTPVAYELDSLVNWGAPGCGPSGSPPYCVYDAFNTGCSAGCTVLTCSCDATVDDYLAGDYWSATTSVADTIRAYTVRFTAGSGYPIVKDSAYHVRAVRGGS